MNKYEPSVIEPKWQKAWIENKTFQPDMDKADKPFYNLMMFPYPSAEGLHIGNMYAFTGADIYGRFKRMQGYDVFEPIGLDGFGIHSENYALKLGEHPKKVAARTEVNFYRQLKASGNAYAWDHILETYDPDYYKWTQWLFIQMFKKGLAYQKEAPVNFCPSCKTVLADEQVIDGRCERCGTVVEIKKLKQWFFRITEYAEKLLQNTYNLDWPEKVLIGQRNWIGKSEGAEIIFKIEGKDIPLHVFTTRIDTIYGVTAMVIAPDKMGKGDTPFALEIATDEQQQKVIEYIEKSRRSGRDPDPKASGEKTGVFTGSFAINPFSGERVPIWVANYVVGWYGTGALMVVPAHDARDFEFAKKYNLPIKRVIKTKQEELPTTDYGVLVESGEFTGLTSEEAIEKMIKFLEDTEQGKKQIQYKLRDWIISRQRYWEAPIPMIYCNSCGWQSVPESQLPVVLPEVKDWRPKGTGKSPLASVEEFVYTDCPKCGEPAQRETDVLDTFLDSAWYFLRYPSTRSAGSGQVPFDSVLTKKWLPVSQYIGGAEHTVLHLLYSRFVTMALHDMGYLDFDEPFPRFYAHGLIIREGVKMSKSKGNVVIPDQYIKKYGVDSLRCYLMFIGPFNHGGDFRDTGMHGMHKFLKRIWNLCGNSQKQEKSTTEMKILLHRTIKRVSQDLAKLKYNTSLAYMMEFVNEWEKEENSVVKEDLVSFLKLLAPFAPHLTEEVFHNLSYNSSIHREIWPVYDESLLVEKNATIVVQVNGKVRSQIVVLQDKSHDREYIIEEALKDERVQKYIKERIQAKKTIFVPGKIVNFVI